MRRAILLAILTLVAPLASAALAQGDLEVSGEISFAGSVLLTSTPSALFVPNATGAQLTADASRAHVRVFEQSYVSASALGQRPILVLDSRERSWDLNDLRLTTDPADRGWMGLHARSGTLIETAEKALEIRIRNGGAIGNADNAPDREQPAFSHYRVEMDGGYLGRESHAWTYSGAGSLKILGPAVTLVSRENTTTIETGEMPDPQNRGQTLLRWIVVETQAGTVASSHRATAVASKSLHATWDGQATIRQARGALVSDDMRWQADGGTETIEGTIESMLTAKPEGGAATMTLRGDLRSSTLSALTPAPGGPGSTQTWILVLVAAVVLGGAGAANFVLRRQRNSRAPPMAADEFAALADRAADAENYAEAVAWAERARRLSPTSRRVALDHAFFVWMTGDRGEAIRLLQNPVLGQDPDAHLLLARLHLADNNPEAAAAAIVHALQASPVMLLEIEAEAEFDPLLIRPEVRSALRHARRKLT